MLEILLLNIGMILFAQENNKVDDIDLSKFSIKKTNICSITVDKNNISMDPSTLAYYNKLSTLDKKIYIRLARNGFLKKDAKKDKPFIFVYKENGTFYMESLAHVDMSLKSALPVIKDFPEYHSWLLKDINTRRGGQGGEYFVEFQKMAYKKDLKGGFWDFRVKMNSIFGGYYTVAFRLEDKLNEGPVPSFSMILKEASNIAHTMNGHFRFLHLPCDDTFFVGYFYGDTELHWMLYDFLPVKVVNSQVGERIETMLENINYKADDVIIQKRRARHITKK